MNRLMLSVVLLLIYNNSRAQKKIYNLEKNQSIHIFSQTEEYTSCYGLDYSYNILNNAAIGGNIHYINMDGVSGMSDVMQVTKGFMINPEIKYFFKRKNGRNNTNFFIANGVYFKNYVVSLKYSEETAVPGVRKLLTAETTELGIGLSPRIGMETFMTKNKRILLEISFLSYAGLLKKNNKGDTFQMWNYKAETSNQFKLTGGFRIGLGYLLFKNKAQN